MTNVIRLASARERPTVKACATCRFRKWSAMGDDCGAVGGRSANMERFNGICGSDGALWEPKIGLLPAIRKWLFGELS